MIPKRQPMGACRTVKEAEVGARLNVPMPGKVVSDGEWI